MAKLPRTDLSAKNGFCLQECKKDLFCLMKANILIWKYINKQIFLNRSTLIYVTKKLFFQGLHCTYISFSEAVWFIVYYVIWMSQTMILSRLTMHCLTTDCLRSPCKLLKGYNTWIIFSITWLIHLNLNKFFMYALFMHHRLFWHCTHDKHIWLWGFVCHHQLHYLSFHLDLSTQIIFKNISHIVWSL